MASLPLFQADVGDDLLIRCITDPDAALMATRLGLVEGETIRLAAKVPGGPVVVERHGMELALGREIARVIEVIRQ